MARLGHQHRPLARGPQLLGQAPPELDGNLAWPRGTSLARRVPGELEPRLESGARCGATRQWSRVAAGKHSDQCARRRCGSAEPPWLPFAVLPASATAGYRASDPRRVRGFLEPFTPIGGGSRPCPLAGIVLSVAVGTAPHADLVTKCAGAMQSAYGVPARKAR
jgi:hypothetical protein